MKKKVSSPSCLTRQLRFDNHQMAAATAKYNSLIATCRRAKVSVKQYFTKLISEMVKGNKNWEQLLPMTIGIPVNKDYNCL